MRSIKIAAIAALAFASATQAATPVPPYKLDNGGRCHDSTGRFVMNTLCKMVQPKHCRDPRTGRFVSCVIIGSHGQPITDSNGNVM
jgi:hypothetical protein